MSTLVVGAGMAGLAAAHQLAAAGEAVTVLEARERLGGRVYTTRNLCPFPVELGAEFIHGSQVPTWELVDSLGLTTVKWAKTDDSMVRLVDGNWLDMATARQTYPDFDLTRSWDLSDQPATEDESWQVYLERLGFSDFQLQYTQRMFANALGENPDVISAQAVLELLAGKAAQDGAGDFRVLEGYDRLLEHLAAELDIRQRTPVAVVQWGDDGVTVLAATGESFHADRAIIAVPLGVLQKKSIQFIPALPYNKQRALLKLQMGPALKMVYVFDRPVLPEGAHIGAIYSDGLPPMWWSPSFKRETDEQVWTAFATGDYARQLGRMDERDALQAGLETLRAETGQPDLTPLKTYFMNWTDDPYTGGGYSVALPGGQTARARLATPTPPLFWAGEATANNVQAATVHGAYLSGLRAAGEVLDAG